MLFVHVHVVCMCHDVVERGDDDDDAGRCRSDASSQGSDPWPCRFCSGRARLSHGGRGRCPHRTRARERLSATSAFAPHQNGSRQKSRIIESSRRESPVPAATPLRLKVLTGWTQYLRGQFFAYERAILFVLLKSASRANTDDERTDGRDDGGLLRACGTEPKTRAVESSQSFSQAPLMATQRARHSA